MITLPKYPGAPGLGEEGFGSYIWDNNLKKWVKKPKVVRTKSDQLPQTPALQRAQQQLAQMQQMQQT